MKSILTAICALVMVLLCACNEKKATSESNNASVAPETSVQTSVTDDASASTEAPVADAKLTVIDFYATWCGPCKTMAPVVEKMKKKYPNVEFKKVDIDQEQELAMQYQVDAVPTFVFKTDKGEDRMVGSCSEAEFEAAIKKALK